MLGLKLWTPTSDYGFQDNMASELAATVHRAQKKLVTCRHTRFSDFHIDSFTQLSFLVGQMFSGEESNYDINNVCAPTMTAPLSIILGLFCLVPFEDRSLYVALADLKLDM